MVNAGEVIATLAIIVGTVVVMRVRGESWKRTALGGLLAWLASGIIIIATVVARGQAGF